MDFFATGESSLSDSSEESISSHLQQESGLETRAEDKGSNSSRQKTPDTQVPQSLPRAALQTPALAALRVNNPPPGLPYLVINDATLQDDVQAQGLDQIQWYRAAITPNTADRMHVLAASRRGRPRAPASALLLCCSVSEWHYHHLHGGRGPCYRTQR